MPIKETLNTTLGVLFSCYAHKSREGEHFVPEHVFSYTWAGSSEVFMGGKHYIFKEGDFRFCARNQLARYTKYPPPGGGEYSSVSIRLDQDTLRSISKELNLSADRHYTGERTLILQPNNLLRNFVDSLAPYVGGKGTFNQSMITLKAKEIIMILLETSPAFKNILFDFSEPGKIDLEAYMNEHYKFNVDISRFAYLTGRSLATFKRDFEKIFHTSPNRWLQQKRLHDAYFLLKEKGHKVTDVYMDVGFKDLSHFSFAFKKAYGVTPSSLA